MTKTDRYRFEWSDGTKDLKKSPTSFRVLLRNKPNFPYQAKQAFACWQAFQYLWRYSYMESLCKKKKQIQCVTSKLGWMCRGCTSIKTQSLTPHHLKNTHTHLKTICAPSNSVPVPNICAPSNKRKVQHTIPSADWAMNIVEFWPNNTS